MDTIGKAQWLLFPFLCILPCFATEIRVRLSDMNGKESETGEGRVEFFLDGEWGGICFNDFLKEDGGVVCRHLNFTGIRDFSFQSPREDGQHHDVEISCYGHEDNLQNCSLSKVDLNVGYKCNNSTPHIRCHSDLTPKADRKVRLIGGDGSFGKVEFNSRGSWQTICGNEWGLLEGGVVCRELGFLGVASYTLQPDTTKDFVAGFKCYGYEISLTECQIYDDLDGFESHEETLYCDKSVEVICLCDIHVLLSPYKHIHKMEVGENLTLTCKATNQNKVFWEHLSLLEEKAIHNTSILSIQDISVTDQGTYVCVAEGLRGQIVRSHETKIVLTDYLQVLVIIERNSSFETSDENIKEIRNIMHEKFQEAGYKVTAKGKADVNLTVLLSKALPTDSNYDSIPYNISVILKEVVDDLEQNLSISNTSIQPLSFCENNSVQSDAGLLSFSGTKVNSNATSHELCFISNVSRASRECSGDFLTPAVWKDAVLRNCFKPTETFTGNSDKLVEDFLENVEESNITPDNASYISHDLTVITSVAETSEERVNQVAGILEDVVNANSPSETVTRNVIETVDNVVNQSVQNGIELNSRTSSTLLNSLDAQLKTVMGTGQIFSEKQDNIVVNVVQIRDLNSSVSFTYFHDGNESVTTVNQNSSDMERENIQAKVEISDVILRSMDCKWNSSEDTVPISFIIHHKGALFQDPQANEKQKSVIISVLMVCNVSNLTEDYAVLLQFPKIPEVNTDQSRWECVFWNDDLTRDGDRIGGWSSKGWLNRNESLNIPSVDSCSNPTRVGNNAILYNCKWSHLTSFAVLLDIRGDIGIKALDVLSIVGCSTSIVSLLVAIVSHLCIKQLRRNLSEQITIMLCSALLCLYCFFLIGINWTEPPVVCIIFAAFIHIFCLASVAWMSIEATQLYLLLVRVFNAYVDKFLIKASVIAWGFPVVIVATCIVIDLDDYNHTAYCFPTNSVFKYGVFGPVALLLIYNIILYIIVIWNISFKRSTSQSNTTVIVRGVQNACFISALLGVSWVFGFLAAIKGARLIFSILFCLFNTFQGFFIFIFFCLRRPEIREAWRNWFGIAICLRTRHDPGVAQGKPSTSNVQSMQGKSERVDTSASKITSESQKEFLDSENRELQEMEF